MGTPGHVSYSESPSSGLEGPDGRVERWQPWASLAFSADDCSFLPHPQQPRRTPNQGGEALGKVTVCNPPPDLDPLELSTGEELSLPLGNSTAVNCSVRGLPTPTLRWTKVRGKEAPPQRGGTPPPPPLPTCLSPSLTARPLACPLPTQDSVPLGDDSTLSLRSITFDSAGTYTCEASMPTVPLLSRTRSFKLLVQGSGAKGAGGLGGWGARTNEPGPPLALRSLLFPSLLPLPLVPPAHPFHPCQPTGPPELRAEEVQPKAEGSWREGDEVKLICRTRGYPEPKLSWSQLGGSVRDPPHIQNLLKPRRPPQSPRGPLPLSGPSTGFSPRLPLHLLHHPRPLSP